MLLFTWLNFISPDDENILSLFIAAYKVHLYSTALVSIHNLQNMSKQSDKCDVAVAEIYYASTWTLIGWQIICCWQRSMSRLVIYSVRNCTESLWVHFYFMMFKKCTSIIYKLVCSPSQGKYLALILKKCS